MNVSIVLVGRPNVGKSTLFNRLTRTQDALVADIPGLTRDRQYGRGRLGNKPFIVIDAGGLEISSDEDLMSAMAKQTVRAIDGADIVLFLVDARSGLVAEDRHIADFLRRRNRTVKVVVNKGEGLDPTVAKSEFFNLGLGEPVVISAAHGDGVNRLINRLLAPFPDSDEQEIIEDHPIFTVIGRPNVGKSTLVNQLLGEERMLVQNEAGTTRDAIATSFNRENQKFTVIDTAGVRRRGKVEEIIEKFSILKTLKAIEKSNVVMLVLDASEAIAHQDAVLAEYAEKAGKAAIVVLNKWDKLDSERKKVMKKELTKKLYFLDYAEVFYVSALLGKGIESLLGAIQRAYLAAFKKFSTSQIMRVLKAAVDKQAPPEVGGIRPKMRYAHQGGSNPPLIVIHGNALHKIPLSYQRYLRRNFSTAFGLVGTPLRLKLVSQENPYAEKGQKKKVSLRREKLSNRIAARLRDRQVNKK